MRDQIDDRRWADTNHALAGSLARLVDEIRFGFRRLTAIGFAAPWRRDAAPDGR